MDVWEDGYAANGGGTYYETALKLHNHGTVRLRWRGTAGRPVREVIMAVGGDLWLKEWLDNAAAFTVSVRLLATLSMEVGELAQVSSVHAFFGRSGLGGMQAMDENECQALADLVNGTMVTLVRLRGNDPAKFKPAGPPVPRETPADPFKLTLPE